MMLWAMAWFCGSLTCCWMTLLKAPLRNQVTPVKLDETPPTCMLHVLPSREVVAEMLLAVRVTLVDPLRVNHHIQILYLNPQSELAEAE